MSSLELADSARGEVADLLDLQLSPLGLAAMDALAPQPGQTIVDIGCGAGQTVQQLASRVGPDGHVIGVDIAPRVLEVARSRTAGLSQVELIQADAAPLPCRTRWQTACIPDSASWHLTIRLLPLPIFAG